MISRDYYMVISISYPISIRITHICLRAKGPSCWYNWGSILHRNEKLSYHNLFTIHLFLFRQINLEHTYILFSKLFIFQVACNQTSNQKKTATCSSMGEYEGDGMWPCRKSSDVNLFLNWPHQVLSHLSIMLNFWELFFSKKKKWNFNGKQEKRIHYLWQAV